MIRNEKEQIADLIEKKDWKKLVQIGEPAVEPLIKVLEDDCSTVRSGAAKVLKKIGWKPSDEKEQVAYLIAQRDWRELVRIGEPAVEPLIKVLGDEDGWDRYGEAEALGKIGDTKAVEPLIKLLDDESERVRIIAAWGLDKIGNSRAVELLIKALEDDRSTVRSGAAKILVNKGWKPSDEKEQVAYHIAKKYWEELVRIGKPAVEPLIKVLGDEDRWVRYGAAEALGKIGDAKAVEPLIKVLGDEDKWVWEAASEALEKIRWKLTQEFTDKTDELEKEKNEVTSKIKDLKLMYSSGDLLDEEYEELRKPLDEKVKQIDEELIKEPEDLAPIIHSIETENRMNEIRSIHIKLLTGIKVLDGIAIFIERISVIGIGDFVGFVVSIFLANAIWNQKKWVRMFSAYFSIPISILQSLYLLSKPDEFYSGIGMIIEVIIVVALLSKCWNEFK